GRIAHAHLPPIDHAADPPVADEPVARVEVAVMPDGRTVPGRAGESALPLDVHSRISLKAVEPLRHLRAALGERDAAPGRRSRRVDLLQGPDERGEVA